MVTIAVDARYLGQFPIGMGFRTYLCQTLLALHKYYRKNKQAYHFYLWSYTPIVEDVKRQLAAVNFTHQLISLPAEWYTRTKNKHFLKKFQAEVLTYPQKISLVFFPQQLELPPSLRRWRQHGIKLVITIHDLIPLSSAAPRKWFKRCYREEARRELKNAIYQYLTLKLCHRYFDTILTVSSHSRVQILNFIGQRYAQKVHVLPLGCDRYFKRIEKATCARFLSSRTLATKLVTPSSQPPLTTSHSAKKITSLLPYKGYIVYFGGYAIRKNIGLGLRAAFEVRAELTQHPRSPAIKAIPPAIPIVCVGATHERSGGWYKNPHLKPYWTSIVHLDYLDTSDLAKLIAGARYSLQPSTVEGFGLPILESLRCHTLPICSNIPTNRDLLGKAYPYFDPYDLDDIKRVIKYFLTLSAANEKKLLLQVFQQSKTFTWENHARLFQKVLEKTLNLA